MPVDPNIVLIGPSGAGKTEIGRRLAAVLGRPLLDTDVLIVEKEGRSIADIFEQDSEQGFRLIESEAVAEAAATDGTVVTTGGGAVLDPASVARLRDSGVVVYLKVDPAVAAQRIGAANGRPLLDGEPVRERLETIILEREAAYLAAADHVVDANRPAQDVIDMLAGIWEAVRNPQSDVAHRWRLRS